VQDDRGVSDFEALQAALRFKTAHLIFYAFKPELNLKVRHLAFGSGLLRHATVRGLR
jgi:hypothetical protein